jgi:hypothetical protein
VATWTVAGRSTTKLVAHLPDPENLLRQRRKLPPRRQRQIDAGADVIKFATTGGVNSGTGLATRMYEDEARALVDTAHAYGRKVGGSSPMARTASSWRFVPARIRSSMARDGR